MTPPCIVQPVSTGCPWLHLLFSVSFVDLATGLLAQALYSWKPALDDLILSSDTGFLEHFSLLRANLPLLPTPCPQQESQLLPSKSPSQSFIGRVISPQAFLTGPLDKPEQLRPHGHTFNSQISGPPCEGKHLPHNLTLMDALHGRTRLQCPLQALPTALPRPHPPPSSPLALSSLLNHQTLWKSCLHMLSPHPHLLLTPQPTPNWIPFSPIHSFIHSSKSISTQHHILWVPRGKFLLLRSPAPSWSLSLMDTHF